MSSTAGRAGRAGHTGLQLIEPVAVEEERKTA